MPFLAFLRGMGACISSAKAEDNSASQSSTEPPPIKKKDESEIVVALLGQGESGKSTIFKQMKIIQAREEGTADFTEEERLALRHTVWSNVISQMRILLRVARDEQMEYSSPAVRAHAEQLADDMLQLEPGSEMARDTLKELWAEESLKVIYGERDRLFNLSDGVVHFWNALDRVFSPGYMPSNDDILRIRLRTVGFDEAVFSYKGSRFRVLDVGGQRSERRNWQEQLNKATCIMFVSSLTEFDQQLREDFSQSRLEETMHLWAELTDLVARRQSKDLALILLLNKLDLFQEKMRGPSKTNFQRYFKSYKGQLAWAPCAAHVRDTFLAMAGPKGVDVTVHLVSAVESDSARLLWQDVRDMLRDRLLRNLGLM